MLSTAFFHTVLSLHLHFAVSCFVLPLKFALNSVIISRLSGHAVAPKSRFWRVSVRVDVSVSVRVRQRKTVESLGVCMRVTVAVSVCLCANGDI